MSIIKSIISPSAKLVLMVDETVRYDHPIDTASLIDSNTVDPNDILTRKYEWEIATHTTFDSIAYRPFLRYLLNKHEKLKIAYRFPLVFRVVYLPGSDHEAGKETAEYWESLHRKYANSAGVLEFSEIFYSVDRSRAVLYYAIHRKKGKGCTVLFQKVKGK